MQNGFQLAHVLSQRESKLMESQTSDVADDGEESV